MAVELLWAEAFLAVAGENRLQGSVPPFDGLQGGQGRIHPLIGQMIQNGVGFLASRHGS